MEWGNSERLHCTGERDFLLLNVLRQCPFLLIDVIYEREGKALRSRKVNRWEVGKVRRWKMEKGEAVMSGEVEVGSGEGEAVGNGS
jgi:hypothetical protein